MQNYGGRDQATGFYYDRLLKAGAVDEEFQLYGCMYLSETEPGFYITGKEQKMFDFLLQCEQQGVYCTPVLLQTYWTKVACGERQKLKRQYQFNVVKRLESLYGTLFFSVVQELNCVGGNNAAESLLQEWKEQLDGCCDVDLLHLYEETVAMAVQMKLLFSDKAEKFFKWVKQVEEQLTHDELLQEGDAHTYAGLAYMAGNSETICYLQFGKHYAAWQKRQQLILEGNIVSPVFRKQMFFSATDFRIIQQKKQEFETCMREKMSVEYFDYLKQLYTLPTVFSKEKYRKIFDTMAKQWNQNEKKAFQLYSAQLRML